MPPRFAYWTILIDNAPTAFRAREAEELLPTVAQLRRTNANVILKWFARGRLWDSQQQERDDFQRRKWRPARPHGGAGGEVQPERRSKEWRPGGDHKDPRARFKRDKKSGKKPFQKSADRTGKPWDPKANQRDRPWHAKTGQRDRPRHSKPGQKDRPWHSKPGGVAKSRGEDRRFKPRKPHGPPFKTKWAKDGDPRKKHDTPEDE